MHVWYLGNGVEQLLGIAAILLVYIPSKTSVIPSVWLGKVMLSLLRLRIKR